MPTKSQAVVVAELNGKWNIEDVEVPDPNPNEILVKTIASGVCHSDLSLQNGTLPYNFPSVFGHEGAGIAEKVGSNVKSVKVGDKVLCSWSYCQTCNDCQTGHPAHCTSWPALNLTGNRSDGTVGFKNSKHGDIKSSFLGQSSFARHFLADESSVLVVPKDTSDKDLALYSPLGCGQITGAGAVLNILKPHQGSTVAVFGIGAVGAAAVMGAAISPCSKIIAIDLQDNRLELAKKCGATHTINARNKDAVEEIKALTGGRGVDFAIECTGVTRCVSQCIDALASRGTAASIGIPPTTETVPVNIWSQILFGKKYIGALEGDCQPKQLVQFLMELHQAGRYPFDLLTKTYPFDKVADAFEDMKSGAVIKPILVWDM